MCDPLTIAGVAATAGSVVANSMAQGDIASARSGVLAGERTRQAALTDEAGKINTKSQDTYTDFTGDQTTRAAQLGDLLKQPMPNNPGPAAVLPTSSSNIVTREVAKKGAEATQFGDQQATALGELRAFGDVLGDKSRGQARDASLINQLGGFKKGSSQVTAFELDEANSAGDGAKFFGDILAGVGKVAVNAGLSGGSLGGTAAPASTAAPSVSQAFGVTYPTPSFQAPAAMPWGPTYAQRIPAEYLKFN